MVLFATPAHAYQILPIPPGDLSLIVCGNGNVFPWVGPNGDAMAAGLCQGTVIPNVHFDLRNVDVKRLLREQKPAKFEEEAYEARTRPSPSIR
jgi:hypothetical protein